MKKESSVAKAIRDVPSFGARYEFFRLHLENESKSSSTIRNYGLQLSRICLHYGRIPEEISGEEYALYYNALLKDNATGTLMRHAVYSVRCYFRLSGIKCPLGANPRIPANRTLPVILSNDETRALLRRCTDIREKALLGLLYDSGMRKSEMLSLCLSDLDYERGMIHIRDGKGHKDRYVPLSRNMRRVMSAYCKSYNPRSYVFERGDGVPMPQAWPSKVLSEAVKRAGIIKHVFCHTLRHTYACDLLMAGVDIRHIQLWLGHKRLETTATYLTIVNAPTDGRWIGPTDIIFPVKR